MHYKTVVQYDDNRQLVLACDSSLYGLGAVPSNIMDDGQESLIAYASSTLTAAERNYSQLEKEVLGVVFALHKMLEISSLSQTTNHCLLFSIAAKPCHQLLPLES